MDYKLGDYEKLQRTNKSISIKEKRKIMVQQLELLGAEEFHDSEIVECHEDCLASEFFQEWFLANDNYILKKNECVGYKVPLFLNGEDEIENLEISDMEVYWTVLTPLINI